MRIAQVSPLMESVPPRYYGGTERVVSYLTEELVQQGHEVTLFASGDSKTSADLRAVCPRALRLAQCMNPLPYHVMLVEQVFREADRFDVIHFHCDYLHFPMTRHHPGTPALTTLHGRLDSPELVPLYREFDDMALVSISDSQRLPLPWPRWIGTVHHGLPVDRFRLSQEPDDYLAFLGRVSPEKGIEQAIEIARRSGRKLRIAAKVDPADRVYFETVVRPMLDTPGVEFIGEIGEHHKQEFLGGARALLFPIDWEEPFGLVMIEAMACGTPVLAFRRGSVPEVIEPGVSGLIVDDVDEAVGVIDEAEGMDRATCRRAFEERFRVDRMARRYLSLYDRVASARDLTCGMASKS
jgi:glycosyltransferase involved in cell wall biosynthesis